MAWEMLSTSAWRKHWFNHLHPPWWGCWGSTTFQSQPSGILEALGKANQQQTLRTIRTKLLFQVVKPLFWNNHSYMISLHLYVIYIYITSTIRYHTCCKSGRVSLPTGSVVKSEAVDLSPLRKEKQEQHVVDSVGWLLGRPSWLC